MVTAISRRRVLRLEYLTVAWMAVEAAVAVSSGLVAGSIALVGFGLDSVIEILAAGVVIWQVRGAHDEERERAALKLIAVTFVLLAGYIVVASTHELLAHEAPEHSVAGIAVAAAAIVVMPLLGGTKRRAARATGNTALGAEAQESILCACLAAAVLVGLVLNATLAWWWADPLASYVVAGLALREANRARRGDTCC